MQFLKSLFGKKSANVVEDGNLVLVHAMEAVAANDNPENRKKLYEALQNAMLLIPVPEIPAGLSQEVGIQTIKEAVEIQMIGFHDAEGVRTTPAFTDVEALRNWDPNTPYIGLRSADLFRFLLDKEPLDVLINPFDPIRKMIRAGGRVTRREIEQLAQGVAPTNSGIQPLHLKKEEKVLIGLPADPPSAAARDLLRNKASEIAEVADVYFFQMVRGSTPSTVVGVGLTQNVSEDRKQQIMESLGSAIRGQFPPGSVSGLHVSARWFWRSHSKDRRADLPPIDNTMPASRRSHPIPVLSRLASGLRCSRRCAHQDQRRDPRRR